MRRKSIGKDHDSVVIFMDAAAYCLPKKGEQKFAMGLTGSAQQSVIVKYNLRHVCIGVSESDRNKHSVHAIYHLSKIVFNLLSSSAAFIIFDDEPLFFVCVLCVCEFLQIEPTGLKRSDLDGCTSYIVHPCVY